MVANGDAPLVGIVMGSRSDWETMQHASQLLERLGVAHEVRVVSAHRTPDRLFEYAAGGVRRVDDASQAASLREALVTRDHKLVYRVDDGIPVLLVEEAIATSQVPDFPKH